jgi:triphosphoribosyl-dephospho-CoA synthase
VKEALERAGDEERRIEALTELDRKLKAQAINPGTSADLTVACLLVHHLKHCLA